MNTPPTGTMETTFKVLDTTVDPVAFFQALQPGPHAFLLESADIIEKYGEKSTGCTDPSLRITMRNHRFQVRALNSRGRKYLRYLPPFLGFARNLEQSEDCLAGVIQPSGTFQDEESRLAAADVFDLLRALIFRFKPRLNLDLPLGGLYGIIGYDAIDYVEQLPPQEDDGLPEFDFYFADNLFVMDHLQNKTYLVSNLPLFHPDDSKDAYDCQETIRRMEQVFRQTGTYCPPPAPVPPPEVETDVPDQAFAARVRDVQAHIASGDIFQAVLSRSFRLPVSEDPLGIYARLKAINPGPYMFLFQSPEYTLLGSSPETCLKVTGNGQKSVEIRPIAGTLPRGRNAAGIDLELDSRYELDLLHDRKELAEHCMLVDLARNDIARVAVPGSRFTSELLRVEKYSHVQHLVSTVRGILRPELDALHAYKATMNMGTLTGAPKIKAMGLIRQYERSKRGFYGGAVCYLTPDGRFDSCIVIRAIFLQQGMATVRAGAGIVLDSVPASEAAETRRKAQACLEALGVIA